MGRSVRDVLAFGSCSHYAFHMVLEPVILGDRLKMYVSLLLLGTYHCSTTHKCPTEIYRFLFSIVYNEH